jgi:hypothetical protein
VRQIRVERIGYPEDDDRVALGMGTDLGSSESIRFVVPPEAVLTVLASLHADEQPVIPVHEFDIVDWTVWWEEVGDSEDSDPSTR